MRESHKKCYCDVAGGGEGKGKLSRLEKNFFWVLIRLKIEDAFLRKTVWGSYLVCYREYFKLLSFLRFGDALTKCTVYVLYAFQIVPVFKRVRWQSESLWVQG